MVFQRNGCPSCRQSFTHPYPPPSQSQPLTPSEPSGRPACPPPNPVSSVLMALWKKLILAVLIVVTLLATYMVYVNQSQSTCPYQCHIPLKEPDQATER